MNPQSLARALTSALRKMRALPLVLAYFVTNEQGMIDADVTAAAQTWPGGKVARLLGLLAHHRCARVIYYYRLANGNVNGRMFGMVLSAIYRPGITPDLDAKRIGPGFVFVHGFSTIVRAHEIGERCTVFQNVTVGLKAPSPRGPTIGDHVTIYTGAAVIGDIHIGDNAIIGANAVVLDDVPAGGIAVGVPARIHYR